MEDTLKGLVLKALEAKLGYSVDITRTEWDDVKAGALNDVYVNKFCFCENVSSKIFINTMVNLLLIAKRDIA